MSDEQLPPQGPPPPPPPPPQQQPPATGYRAPYAQPGPGAYAYPPNYGAGYGVPPRRSGWFWATIFLCVAGVVAIAIVGIVCATIRLPFEHSDNTTYGKDSIAVIDIDGVITNADAVNRQLEKFGDNSDVKAIILHINSPGGGAAASQEIYHEVLRVRQQKHKLIVASVESVGASGAYYIASACDKIYANPASVVGSIGVIMEWTNYGELMQWAKLKHVTIHAGVFKDAGDPTRDMTPQEQAYFQALVDNMYGQFVHDVAVGRKTTDATIQPLATGQVWTGQEALGLHLIDAEGGYRVALMDTAKTVGISGEPHVVRTPKENRGLLRLLDGGANDIFPDPSKLLDQSPGFYFLWK